MNEANAPNTSETSTPRHEAGGIEKLAITVGDVASLAFPIAFILTIWEIVARMVFNSPTIWTIEVALLISGIAYIAIGPQTTALESHIRIDVLTNALSQKAQARLQVVAAIGSILFGAVVTYSGARLAIPLMDGWERTGSALNSPAPSIIKLLIPCAGVVWTMLEVRRLIRLVR